jgi:methylase of polypeptide subunit release factors
MQVSYTKRDFLEGKCGVHHNPLYDGGGSSIGYDMCKNQSVLTHISNINTTLEMCSGPGFIGYYLLFNNLTKQLWLSDKFDGILPGIAETNKSNNVDVSFIHSDCFQNFPKDLKFDLIIGNPPHFQKDEKWIWDRKTKDEVDASYRINLDEDLKFHKEFFKNVKNYLNKNGKIIFVENNAFINDKTISELAGNEFKSEVINDVNENKEFYYIILTLI